MQQLFAQGRIGEAAALYDAHAAGAPYSTTLLRVRIHLKLGEDAAARALLRSKPAPREKKLQAAHALLSGAAHTVGGRYDVADEEFAYAEALARELGDSEIVSEIAYRRALRYAISGNFARASQSAAQIRASSSIDAAINAAFAEQFILARQQRYPEQAEVDAALLERLESADGYTEARLHAVWNLAILARELYLPQYTALLQRLVDSIDWPADFTRHRFETLKALGWSYALYGDTFNAFRRLKQALVEAAKEPDRNISLARRCVAHLDRAYLARGNGERIFERQELEEAATLAREVQWSALQGEERVALLLLAELFAPIDSGTATYYIAQYDALPGMVSKLQHFTGDARLQHLANYSRAIVDLTAGHRKSASALLRKCYAYFEKVRYGWRAGRCALRLFELSGDRQWLERAREMLRDYPASWLARDVRRQEGAPPGSSDMPPMQRKVFEGICKGLSNREIAHMLGRSDFTVRNHVKLIFKRFSVSSRSALIAEALRRKLI